MAEAITKQQWEEIEDKLQGLLATVKFRYKGYEVTVQKNFVAENKMALNVYIDGRFKGDWAFLDYPRGNEDRSDREPPPAIIRDVWRKQTKAVYSPQRKQKMIKAVGTRRAYEMFPNLDEKRILYWPDFAKAKTLVRQFRKLEGITLVEESHA
jgi:hypothetical protein